MQTPEEEWGKELSQHVTQKTIRSQAGCLVWLELAQWSFRLWQSVPGHHLRKDRL